MARIPWSRIREAFAGEWVELVEYSWEGDSSYPKAAVVRHHSSNRSELLRTMVRSGRVEGAVVLFVGSIVPGFLARTGATSHDSAI